MRRLKKKLDREGVIKDVRGNRYFEKPSVSKRRRDKIHAVAKQGVFYDPKTADPLSSRLVHRFMFAEFLGSLFFQLIA